MAENTKIEWATHTMNPWRGCSKVHTGCAHCYAEATSKRNETILGTWGPNGTRVVAADRAWLEVFKWNNAAAKAGRRDRVFCASLADVFEDWSGPMLDHHGRRLWISKRGTKSWEFDDGSPGFAFEKRHGTLDDVRRRLFALIDSTPSLDWLLLTKRPENVRKFWPENSPERIAELWGTRGGGNAVKYRPNVWIGTSISDQETADRWTPELLKLRDLAPVLFLSAEPLVGTVDLLYPSSMFPDGPRRCCDGRECGCRGIPVDPWMIYGVDLVIVGGESGPGARPCVTTWVRAIVEQCKIAGVACFVKQLGGDPRPSIHPNDSHVLRILDPKGGNPDEWPLDLRVRQMPEVVLAQ